MTEKWTPRNTGRGLSRWASDNIHELMSDGRERTGDEIIDALLVRPTGNGRTLKCSVPTRRELSSFMQHNKYSRRRGYVKERLPNGSTVSKLRTFYRKPDNN